MPYSRQQAGAATGPAGAVASDDQEMVVHCKSGMRSAKAIAFLREAGFHKLKNLTGGIIGMGAEGQSDDANVLTHYSPQPAAPAREEPGRRPSPSTGCRTGSS